ncbi:MAG: hypothetical protein ACPL3C_08060, partial [Pyrobaculum sp.]
VGPYMSRALDLIDAFGIYVLATVPLAVATTYAIHDRRKIPSMALYLAATYAALILIINYEGTIYSWLLLFSLWLAAAVTSITHYTTIHIKTCRIRCIEEKIGKIDDAAKAQLQQLKERYINDPRPEQKIQTLWQAAQLYLQNILSTCGAKNTATTVDRLINCAIDIGAVDEKYAEDLKKLKKQAEAAARGKQIHEADLYIHCRKVADLLAWGSETCATQ